MGRGYGEGESQDSSDDETLEASSAASFALKESGRTQTQAVAPDGTLPRAIGGALGGRPPLALAAGLAGLSVAASATAVAFSPLDVVVFAAGGLLCALGPHAYRQHRRLTATDETTLQETRAALSRLVEGLGQENRRLHEAVADLNHTVHRLEDLEQALDVITRTECPSIAAFEAQLRRNRELLRDMPSNRRAEVLQLLLPWALRRDAGGHATLEERDVGDLVKRLRGMDGVDVKEKPFREALAKSGGPAHCVMDIIRNLMSDDRTAAEDIFVIED